MSCKRFENEIYTMNIYNDGYLEFMVKKDATLSEKELWQSKQEAETYMPGKKFFVIFGGDEFFNITKEARELASSDAFSSHIAAVALYSNDLALKILGNLYIKINKPIANTQFFNNRERAEEWLRVTMKSS